MAATFTFINPSAENFNEKKQWRELGFTTEFQRFVESGEFKKQQSGRIIFGSGWYSYNFVDITATWKFKDGEVKTGKVSYIGVDPSCAVGICVEEEDGTKTTLEYWELKNPACMPEFIELSH